MTRNLKREFEETINSVKKLNVKPELLLHSCCAPCSSYVLEQLTGHFKVSVYYYNPNIHPAEEYLRRESEQKRLIKEFSSEFPVKFIQAEYNPDDFYKAVSGHEDSPEGGTRCGLCFKLRLRETARYASENGFGWFSTTLSVSPHKNSAVIAQIAEEAAEEYAVMALPADFKKNGGYARSIELSKKFGLYRQNYCGCEFSG